MTSEEREAVKRRLRMKHEMSIRRNLARWWVQVQAMHGRKVPMTEVIETYEALASVTSLWLTSEQYSLEERQIHREVFNEVMDAVRNEANRWSTM